MSGRRSEPSWKDFATGLYDGVSAAGYFLRTTQKLERVFGGCTVQWTTLNRKSMDVLDNCWSTPSAPKLIEEYVEHIQPIDPRIAGSLSNYGQFLPCWKVVDAEAFDKSIVVGEWTDRKEVDRRWTAACIWDIDEGHTGLLALLRSRKDGPFQIDELAVPKRLRNHIRRAAQLHYLFRDHWPRGRAFDDAWGSRTRPVFLLGKGRRLLASNPAGEDLLAMGDVFQTRWGELTARSPRLLATLDNALAAAHRFDLDIHPRPIVFGWPRYGGMTALKAEVMAIPGVAAEIGLGEQAQALIMCREVLRRPVR